MHEFLKKMSNKGISTSIDDFGTGYSSLAAIRDYKVNEMMEKIENLDGIEWCIGYSKIAKKFL